MRKLATIQRISAISPIVGADAIELAFVLGWQVVVKKGDFAVGDLAVYFEIDSWLDETNPAYETFRERFSNWTDPEGKPRHGMRLKTIKLRKQLSQGLLLKLATFPALGLGQGAVVEGEDVTDTLGVEKWEPYEEVRGNNGGVQKEAGAKQFPSFIRKTDQERIQNYINELPKHADETFEVTIKLDGSSMTVYRVVKGSLHYDHVVEDTEKRMLKRMGFFKKAWWKVSRKLGLNNPPETFYGVCSRNIQMGESGNHFGDYVTKHDLFTKINAGLFDTESFAFQGELIAPSIQGNYEKVKDFEYYVYDVFDIDKQEYLLPQKAREVTKACGLKYVPVLTTEAVLAVGPAPKEAVDAILAYAEGPGMNPGVKREGVVYKSNSTPFSFKAVSTEYLLRKG